MRSAMIVISMVTIGALSAMPVSAADEQRCSLKNFAELPITMAGTRPLIAGTINGTSGLFLIDSGAPFSVIARAAVEKFRLRLGDTVVIGGTSGLVNARIAKGNDFALTGLQGGRVFRGVDFIVTGGSDVYGKGADGLIGQNVFGHRDMEFDLANGFVRLFTEENCGSRSLAYWSGNASVGVMDIQYSTTTGYHIIGTASLNNTKIRVVFDSGAAQSVLTLKAAARAGIKPDQEDVKAAGIGKGIGHSVRETSIARFEVLDLGGETIRNARLLISDISIGNTGDMLLGADFFLSHRIFVSLPQRKLYFTYNGGRVFDLNGIDKSSDTIDSAAIEPHKTDSTMQSATPNASDALAPNNVADLKRRGAAFVSRKEYGKAIPDFDAVLKLEPNESDAYYQRGVARARSKQQQLALDDFNQALQIKPDQAAALFERGTIWMAMKNESEARADFDAAMRYSPDDATLGLRIAQIYSEASRYDEAIQRIDQWLAKYPHDGRLPLALNGRCRVRTLAGKDLDIALNDCNAAIKKGFRASDAFDSRGQLYLRRGEMDKAILDFKAALKLQPKNATAMYGLGIAQRTQGVTAEGESYMQAASTLMPEVKTHYSRLNIDAASKESRTE